MNANLADSDNSDKLNEKLHSMLNSVDDKTSTQQSAYDRAPNQQEYDRAPNQQKLDK